MWNVSLTSVSGVCYGTFTFLDEDTVCHVPPCFHLFCSQGKVMDLCEVSPVYYPWCSFRWRTTCCQQEASWHLSHCFPPTSAPLNNTLFLYLTLPFLSLHLFLNFPSVFFFFFYKGKWQKRAVSEVSFHTQTFSFGLRNRFQTLATTGTSIKWAFFCSLFLDFFWAVNGLNWITVSSWVLLCPPKCSKHSTFH